MYNVDTITLSMRFIRIKSYMYKSKEKIKKNKKRKNKINRTLKKTKLKLDYDYINDADKRIKSKLILQDKDKVLRNKRIKYLNQSLNNKKYLCNKNIYSKEKSYYWRNNFNGYSVNYNEEFKVLLITIPHFKLEKFNAKQIEEHIKTLIKNVFEFEEEELNELVLNRIDVKCDYYYENVEKLLIIKNIIEKAPDQFFNYKKEMNNEINEKGGYYVTYTSKNIGKNSVGLGT